MKTQELINEAVQFEKYVNENHRKQIKRLEREVAQLKEIKESWQVACYEAESKAVTIQQMHITGSIRLIHSIEALESVLRHGLIEKDGYESVLKQINEAIKFK